MPGVPMLRGWERGAGSGGRPASLHPAPWASGWVMGRGCRPRGRWGGERGCGARQRPGSHPRAPGQGRASPSMFPHQLCSAHRRGRPCCPPCPEPAGRGPPLGRSFPPKRGVGEGQATRGGLRAVGVPGVLAPITLGEA